MLAGGEPGIKGRGRLGQGEALGARRGRSDFRRQRLGVRPRRDVSRIERDFQSCVVRAQQKRRGVRLFGQRNRLLSRAHDRVIPAQPRALERIGPNQRGKGPIGRGRGLVPPFGQHLQRALILSRRGQGMGQEQAEA